MTSGNLTTDFVFVTSKCWKWAKKLMITFLRRSRLQRNFDCWPSKDVETLYHFRVAVWQVLQMFKTVLTQILIKPIKQFNMFLKGRAINVTAVGSTAPSINTTEVLNTGFKSHQLMKWNLTKILMTNHDITSCSSWVCVRVGWFCVSVCACLWWTVHLFSVYVGGFFFLCVVCECVVCCVSL